MQFGYLLQYEELFTCTANPTGLREHYGCKNIPCSPCHRHLVGRNRILIVEYVFGMHSTAAQEDQSHFDDETDRLLPEPARAPERGFDCRERCHNRQTV